MLSNKSDLQSGDICLVRFHPAVGGELKRYRPAIVIVSQISNSPFVTVAPCTTSNRHLYPNFEVEIVSQALAKKSLLLCWYLRTVDLGRVKVRLGRLPSVQMAKVRETVKAVIDCGNLL